MKFSMRTLLLSFPWIACALMMARNAYVESQYIPRPKFGMDYPQLTYAILNGDRDKPVRVCDRILVEASGREPYSWNYKIEHPVIPGDSGEFEQVCEHELTPCADAADLYQGKFVEYLNQKHSHDAAWEQQHPAGLVEFKDGTLSIRGVDVNAAGSPRNLIEHRVELRPTYTGPHKLVTAYLAHWTDAETGELVWLPAIDDKVVEVRDEPYLPPPNGDSVIDTGEFGKNVRIIGCTIVGSGDGPMFRLGGYEPSNKQPAPAP